LVNSNSTFNDVPIQLFLTLRFYSLFLLLNNSDENDMILKSVFLQRILVSLKKPVELDVQSDVHLPSRMHETAFSPLINSFIDDVL